MNTAACLNSTDFEWFDAAEAATQQRQSGKVCALSSVAEWIGQIQTLWANGAESRLELASLISSIRNHRAQSRDDGKFSGCFGYLKIFLLFAGLPASASLHNGFDPFPSAR